MVNVSMLSYLVFRCQKSERRYGGSDHSIHANVLGKEKKVSLIKIYLHEFISPVVMKIM